MNLINLYLQNQTKPRDFRVENGDDEATIYIYDVIGGDWFGGISAKDFVAELNGIKAKTIHLRFNSPGGDVFEGRAMATAIAQHPSKVIAHIDALAASSASWMALQADEVEIADGAFLMIHNSWTLAMGDKSTMTETAKLLDQIDETFVADYTKRTSKTTDEVRAWMDAETWFGAQESVDNGFADRIAQPAKKADNQWNLAAYKNAPQKTEESTPQIDRAAMNRMLSFLDQFPA